MSTRRTENPYESFAGDEHIRRRPPLDLIINWMLVIGILAFGYSQFERDWYGYKNELLFFQTVQDGFTPADMDSKFMARGVERNMPYKDSSINEFFVSQWLPKIPFYLLCMGIPFLIGIWRLRKKEYRRLNRVYYLGIVAFLGFVGYSLLTIFKVI